MAPLYTDSNASQPATPPPTPIDQPVKDVDVQSFVKDVIEESRRRLVIVDFWAPWCGPCKQLVPLLEKLVRSKKGAVVLAKVNIDTNPELAQQLRVQSVPTVFAFSQGQPVDGFAGAQPEPQLAAWIDQLIKATGSKAPQAEDYEPALAQAAELLAAGAYQKAESIYADILAESPDTVKAFTGVVRCLIASGAVAEAQDRLDHTPEAFAKAKELVAVRTALELAVAAQTAGDSVALLAQVKKNPNDHQARFDLALAYFAEDQRENAVDELLELVRLDRKWQEEAARKQLVKFFEAFGPTDPLTLSGRRRLSSILFS